MAGKLALAFAIAAGVMASRVTAMGVMPDCLGTLEGDTQRWTECTEAFDRQDSRCKLRSARMSETMQHCLAKGYSREEVNAAMSKGAAAASGYAPHASDAVPEAPAPRPQRGPIPGLRAPEGD